MTARNRRKRQATKEINNAKPKIDVRRPPVKLDGKNKWYAFAMQRSGHTAVLNWLCLQNRPSFFVDHCNKKLSPKKFIFKYVESKNKAEVIRGSKSLKDAKNVLTFYGLENKIVEDLDVDPDRTLVIVRSPYNWKASKWKLAYQAMQRKTNIDGLMEQFGKENKMYVHQLKNQKAYHIFFDNWFADVEYRKRICADLNLKYDDGVRGLNDVLQGSSFDSVDFDGKAQKMDVLNRWKFYEDDPKFKKQVTKSMVNWWLKRLSEYGLKPLSNAPESSKI